MGRLTHRARIQRRPKRSRTLPVPGHYDYGDGKDAGRYFRCWNCGFVCDSKRDALVSGEGQSSPISHLFVDDVFSTDGNPGGQPGAIIHGDNEGVALLSMASIRTGHVIMEQNAGGDEKVIRYDQVPDPGSGGCPFCHSRNWRGDF